jgi:hypothetical protein
LNRIQNSSKNLANNFPMIQTFQKTNFRNGAIKMANGIWRLSTRRLSVGTKRFKNGAKLTKVTTTVNKQDLHGVLLLITGDLLIIIGEDLHHITGAAEEVAMVAQVEDAAVAQDG